MPAPGGTIVETQVYRELHDDVMSSRHVQRSRSRDNGVSSSEAAMRRLLACGKQVCAKQVSQQVQGSSIRQGSQDRAFVFFFGLE